MSNLLKESQPTKVTPWTTVTDKKNSVKKKTVDKNRKVTVSVSEKGKKLKVLPYVFTILVFMIIFVFSQQFKNLSADLFNSARNSSTFGMPTNSDSLKIPGSKT